jgi:hypothetical protein
MPPLSAMAIAMRDSVTVSMSEDRMGICRRSDSESSVARSVSRGRISEYSVASETSSYVSAIGSIPPKNSSAAG